MKYLRHRNIRTTACLGGAILGSVSLGLGQDATKLDQLEKENQELRKRLEALESAMQKEGLTPSGQEPPKAVSALSSMTLSGFTTASYFYDTSVPGDRLSNGYLWNSSHNAFSLNKVKLTLASKPAERSGEKWDAGYRVSLIFGEDAPIVNTGGEAQGFESLREAYVDLNVPVLEGINVKAGQLISLLNYESGDGGAVNANFSQGYQWFFTGNGPAAGVQLGYVFTEWLDMKLRVQNGMYAGPFDANNAKTVMGSLGFKPDGKTWINLIGFGGDESDTMSLRGASVLAGRTFGGHDQITTGFEFDYFHFDLTPGEADLWSVGGWFGYDFTKQIGVALRAEYLNDPDGGGLLNIDLPGRPGTALVSPDPDGDLASLTLTINYRPVPNIKIQPEVRFDTTSYEDAFDGQDKRFLVGLGVSYLF